MRWLVFWLRSIFCAHAWKYEEAECDVYYPNHFDPTTKSGYLEGSHTRVSATCTKCGWHRSYKKF